MLTLNRKAIGIFGGSFDPPHKGHVEISKISLKKIKLKKIYWIITKKNPFKKRPFFSLKQRISKSKKAIKIKKQKNLCLILGSDNLSNFHKWTSWKKIVKLTKLVVFSRKGYDKKSKESIVVKYLNKKNIVYINNKLINVSSSNIKKNYLK